MTSTAERQRAFRERQKAKGLVRSEFWTTQEDAEKLKEFAAQLELLREAYQVGCEIIKES